MEDLTNWVTKEAQNMGIDFACLSQQTKNNIISILMSGLENGFRSRMDSPDLRFAKRRGIGKGNQNVQGSPNQEITKTQSEIDEKCQNMLSADGVICDLPNGSCVNINCPVIDNGRICDNVCINSYGHDCSDNTAIGCADNSCINTNNCTDAVPCEDSLCKNSLTCTDSGGTTQEQSCLDSNCTNIPDNRGGICSDGGGTSGCRDLPCNNDSKCSDLGTVTVYCIDNKCLNSGTQTQGSSCTDTNCNDNPCLNTDCSDGARGYNYCEDNTCIVSGPGGCTHTDDPGHCVDNICNDTIHSVCTDQCDNTHCDDDQCLHNDKYCIDSDSCVDGDCTNERNCIDRKNVSSCTDGSCNNTGNASQCVDDTECYDNSCINSNFCMNETSCNDNSCTNSEKCVNAPSSGCQDKTCSNSGQCDGLSKNDTAGCTDAMCP